MSAPSKVNKENFRLLDLSSDEESEDLQLEIIPSRKKKITRRERNRASVPQHTEINVGSEVQCALRWAVRGTLLLWLLMLTWICAALYDQVSSMKMDIAKVSSSSAGVGDLLQLCHTQMKQLEANASEMSLKLANLEKEHTELAKRVNQTALELGKFSNELSAAPTLADTPRRVTELQRTVADFGSQINGFDGSINSAKKQAVTALSAVEEIRTLLHQLELRTNETIANVTANVKREEDLKNDITSLNTTLVAKVDTLQTRIQEMNKSVSTTPPVSAAPILPNSSANVTMLPAAPTQQPGPPAKPNVLQ